MDDVGGDGGALVYSILAYPNRYLLLKRVILNQIWVCKSKFGGAYLCIPCIPGCVIDDVGGGGGGGGI